MSLILSGTDGLSDIDGSAATPAIRGTDANTGIFFPAADTIAFSEGGAEAMRIDSSGNVGIGTSSPSYKLDVRSSLAVLDGSSNIGFWANGSTYTQVWQTLQSVNDFIIQTAASKYMSFGTNSTERMRIDSSGVITSGLGGMQVISGTAVASTSGTSINFTSIPSWVKRITVMFSGVSTNSTSNLLIQLGDSGGIENTGYTSVAQTDGGGSGVFTTGFAVVYAVTAAGLNSGRIEINLITGTTWVASGVVGNNGGNVSAMFGTKALSDVLDRVRITTVNGTDTFDAGTINIMYE